MDKETTTALHESIAHWEDMLRCGHHVDIDLGCRSCALCGMFVANHPTCSGCPVYEDTGYSYCHGTPYGDASEAFDNWQDFNEEHEEFVDAMLHFKEKAKRMLDYLVELLPDGERDSTKPVTKEQAAAT